MVWERMMKKVTTSASTSVRAAIVKQVVRSAHPRDGPPPEDHENKENRADAVPGWNREFLETDQGKLCELMLAANNLDSQGLLDVRRKIGANMCKGVS